MSFLIMVIRWLARITGLMLGLMVVITYLSEGIPTAAQIVKPEGWVFIAMAVMVAGAIGAWWKELIGALLMIVGFIGLWIVQQHFPGSWFGVFPLAGLLHLIAWSLGRSHFASETASSSY